MVQQLNGKEVKQRILKYLEDHGPELPVHIAKYMSMNSIFASAFLSEMAGEGLIKISDMKVGGSPVYYPQSRVALLENYIKSLGGKEKEACLLLKEKGILRDDEQTPAIRVALRGLKDFAFPFKKDEKSFWRYFLVSEDEVRIRMQETKETPKQEEKPKAEETKEEKNIGQKAEKIIEQQEKKNEELEKINHELEEKKLELEKLKQEIESRVKTTPEVKSEVKIPEKTPKKIKPKPKKKPVADESFLNEIKQILEKKQIAIINIESFDKKQVIARVKIIESENLLAAFNRKHISDSDILKVSKRAQLMNIPYYILLKGEASKKTKEVIEAYKRLSSIEKIE
jgi:hypothetical protein